MRRHAEAMDQFHRQHLNPYINFHRPCAVPKIITEANGKRRRVYQRWATPFELFQEAAAAARATCGRASRSPNWIAFAQNSIRYRSGAGHAARQTATPGPRRQAAAPEIHRQPGPERRGNDGRWKARKTKRRFPSLPTALGNRCAIPTFPPRRLVVPLSTQNKPKGPSLVTSTLVQAHPSMRICCPRRPA